MKKGDIWVSRQNEKGEWQRPEPVEGELNTELDEGIVSFTPDGSTMYLTKARREPNANTGVEIYTSQRADAKWGAAVKYEITSDTISSYGHPAVSPDGNWLYFSSDMPGGSGGKDLWRVNLKEKQGSLETSANSSTPPATKCSPMCAPTRCSISHPTAIPGSEASTSSKPPSTPRGMEGGKHGAAHELVGR